MLIRMGREARHNIGRAVEAAKPQGFAHVIVCCTTNHEVPIGEVIRL